MDKSIALSNLFSEKSEVIILCDKSDLEKFVAEANQGYEGSFKSDNYSNSVTIKTSRNTIHFVDKTQFKIEVNEQTNP